jgi:hypothetical protein
MPSNARGVRDGVSKMLPVIIYLHVVLLQRINFI